MIGREFAYELLEAVAGLSEDDLQGALDQLAEAGLVFRRGDPPNATYTFKHALVQETAYNALLRPRREEIHGRIARTLASDFPEVMEANPELIADHYTEAGLDEEAVEFWREAGDLAVARSAPKEAIAHLGQALALLKRFPASPHRSRTELGLQTTLGAALIAARGFAAPEVGEAYARAQQLCEELGDDARRLPALFGRWIFLTARAELAEALAVADAMLQLAAAQDDSGPRLIAHRALTNTWFFLGDFAKARGHAETVLAAYEPARHGALATLYSADPYVVSAFFLAHSLALMGHLEQARPWAHAGLARARELAHGVTLAHALHHACVFHQLCREPQALEPLAGELIALAGEHGLAFWQALGRVFRGNHLLEAGQADAGLAELGAGIAALPRHERPPLPALRAGAAGRSLPPERRSRRRPAGDRRGPRAGRGDARARLRALRAAHRGDAAARPRRRCGTGRAGPGALDRAREKAEGEAPGAARHGRARPAVAGPRPQRRGPRTPPAPLRLVHRRPAQRRRARC